MSGMVGSLRESRRSNVIAAAVIASAGTIAAYASVALSGTKVGVVLAAIAIFGPALFYGALTSPVAFPLALYIILIPFDNLLELNAFGTVTKLLAIASGAAMVFYMLRTKRSVAPPDVLVVWLLFYLWMGATTFWAIDTQSSVTLLPTAIQLLLLYAVVAIFPMDLGRLRTVVTAAVAGGLGAAVYGIYLYKTGSAIGGGGRLWITTDTSFVDPNHFSAALLLPLSLSVVGMLWSRRFMARIAYGICAAILLAAMGFSASRGALLGVFALLVYFLIRDRHRIPLAGATALIGAFVLATQTSLIERFQTSLSSGGAGRIDIWKVGFAAFKEFWLLGAGYNNFAFAYDKAFLQVYQLHYAGFHRAPHNLLLGTGVELGLLGVFLVLLAWYGHWRILSSIPMDDPRYPVRLALEGALIASFVAALFLDMMVSKYLWLTFMLVLMVRNTKTETPPHA